MKEGVEYHTFFFLPLHTRLLSKNLLLLSLKSSYFDRCERSYRSMLACVSTVVSVRIGRSKNNFVKIFTEF